MVKNNMIVIVFFLLISFVSCKDQTSSPAPSSGYMILDSVDYVESFPLSFSLTDDAPVSFEIIGMKNFLLYDSLLIAYTGQQDGLWSFYSVNSNEWLGDFLRRGNGPDEFSSDPNVTEATFFKENGQLFAGLYDFYQGKTYRFNIDESLKNRSLSIELVNDSLPINLFNFIMVDSVTFFCKELANDQTQQIRYILKNGKRSIPENLEKLNRATIRPKEDFNILSTIVNQKNDNPNLIVEIPIGLNQINLYSIDDSFGKTICIGNKLDNIDKIQDEIRWNRIYTYANLRVFDDFFAALYINEDEKTYQIKRTKLPIIHLFDWNGNPLAELKLNHFATAFNIDFINGILYIFDIHTDEFFMYDIQYILDELPQSYLSK